MFQDNVSLNVQSYDNANSWSSFRKRSEHVVYPKIGTAVSPRRWRRGGGVRRLTAYIMVWGEFLDSNYKYGCSDLAKK